MSKTLKRVYQISITKAILSIILGPIIITGFTLLTYMSFHAIYLIMAINPHYIDTTIYQAFQYSINGLIWIIKNIYISFVISVSAIWLIAHNMNFRSPNSIQIVYIISFLISAHIFIFYIHEYRVEYMLYFSALILSPMLALLGWCTHQVCYTDVTRYQKNLS